MNNKLFKYSYRQDFRNNGYLLLKNYFNEKEAKTITNFANNIEGWNEEKGKWMTYYEKRNDLKQKSRVEYFTNYDTSLKYFLNSQITSLVNFIYEDKMNLFKDKINWKLPNGSGFRAHQDYPAWADFQPHSYVTAAVFADDNTSDNGCVQFPKNYYQYLKDLNSEDQNLKENINNSELFINNEKNKRLLDSEPNDLGVLKPHIVQELEWVDAETTSRDLLIFDSFVPHKSDKNITNEARRNFYFTYNNSYFGDIYEDYFKRKRIEFPPDIERNIEKDYSQRNSRYNLANPID